VKSNRTEINKRILEVSKMLLTGESNKNILQYASLNWRISDRQTQTYIKQCYDRWYKDFEAKRRANLSYHLAKRADLYFQAYKKKDYKTCLEIAKDEAKILDVYPSERHSIEIERKPDFSKLDEALSKLSVEDLRKLANLSKFKTYPEEEIIKVLEKIPGKQKLLKGSEVKKTNGI